MLKCEGCIALEKQVAELAGRLAALEHQHVTLGAIGQAVGGNATPAAPSTPARQ